MTTVIKFQVLEYKIGFESTGASRTWVKDNILYNNFFLFLKNSIFLTESNNNFNYEVIKIKVATSKRNNIKQTEI